MPLILYGDKVMKKTYFNSKLFLRLFLSYIALITVFFTIYTMVILYETSVSSRANISRYYELRLQELKNLVEGNIVDARNVISRIKSSQIIRNMYIEMSEPNKSIDPYMLYQSINEFRSAQALSSNNNIYNILLLRTGDYRVYTSTDVFILPEVFKGKPVEKEGIFRNTLSSELNLNGVSDLRLNKEYLVYEDTYSYYGDTTKKGSLFVLLDANNIESKVNSMFKDGEDFAVYYGDNCILGKKDKAAGIEFTDKSSMMPDVRYKLVVDRSKFELNVNGTLIFTLLIGAAISILFIFFAYYFSCVYYKPIGNIGSLFFKAHPRKNNNEIDNIMEGINSLIGERDDYKNKVSTVRPFVQQAVLHTLLTGNLEQEEARYLFEANNIPFRYGYFTVAIFNIGINNEPATEQNDLSGVRGYISEAADSFSQSDGITVLCFEKDHFNTVLIINSENKESATSAIYKMHEYVRKKVENSQIVITVGADDSCGDVTAMSLSCANAMKALDSMLLEGRGTVFFYNSQFDNEEIAYYFPGDTQHKIMRAVKNSDIKTIEIVLDDIYNKNISEYDWSPKTIRLLLYELYMITLRILGKMNLIESIKIENEKIENVATLDEIFDYYKKLYTRICSMGSQEAKASDKDREIISFVEENYLNPDISLKMVTEKFGISMKYISMLFKKNLNTGFTEFIHDKRMELATDLLKNSELSVEEVCNSYGYSSILTFRRHFQSATGMNPSDYQKKV
jgi:AraC-type DNA-binding domain-containing proteins